MFQSFRFVGLNQYKAEDKVSWSGEQYGASGEARTRKSLDLSGTIPLSQPNPNSMNTIIVPSHVFWI